MNIRVLVSDDRTTGIVEFVESYQVTSRIVLDAYSLESLIYDIAKVRECLSEPVMETLDVGSRVMAITEPDTTVSHTLGSSPDGIALSIRHPGIGWITALFSREKAKVLGQYLIHQAWSPRR